MKDPYGDLRIELEYSDRSSFSPKLGVGTKPWRGQADVDSQSQTSSVFARGGFAAVRIKVPVGSAMRDVVLTVHHDPFGRKSPKPRKPRSSNHPSPSDRVPLLTPDGRRIFPDPDVVDELVHEVMLVEQWARETEREQSLWECIVVAMQEVTEGMEKKGLDLMDHWE